MSGFGYVCLRRRYTSEAYKFCTLRSADVLGLSYSSACDHDVANIAVWIRHSTLFSVCCNDGKIIYEVKG